MVREELGKRANGCASVFFIGRIIWSESKEMRWLPLLSSSLLF